MEPRLNCAKVTNVLSLLSCSCQRRSVVKVGSATVDSDNRYAVTELSQHPSALSSNANVIRDVIVSCCEPIAGPGRARVFRPKHISTPFYACYWPRAWLMFIFIHQNGRNNTAVQ